MRRHRDGAADGDVLGDPEALLGAASAVFADLGARPYLDRVAQLRDALADAEPAGSMAGS